METTSDHSGTRSDIENPSPPNNTSAAAMTSNNSRKKWMTAFLITTLVVVVAVGISLGVTRRMNNESNSSISSPSKSEAFVDQVVTTEKLRASSVPTGSPSGPTAISTGKENDEQTTRKPSGKPSEKENNEQATRKPSTITTTAVPTKSPSAPVNTPATASLTTQFVKSNGPLQAQVRMIDPTIVDSYDSCDALKDDVINALKYFADSIILAEKANNWYEQCDPNDPYWNPWENMPMAADIPKGESGAVAFESLAASDTGVLEDSYETNNQVEGVDEADVVKSDGKYVFAAYGDILYAWNATDGSKGMSVTRMPYNDTIDENCTVAPWNPMPIVTPNSGGRKARSHQQGRRHQLSMLPYPNPCYKPKPNILSLLLQGSRLTAIVSEDNSYITPYAMDAKQPIINDYSSLTIRVYDISTVPLDGSPLSLLGERKIKGNYNAARSIDSTSVIVTTSYVDTYLFSRDLWRSQFLYCGLNDTEYVEKASKIALNKTEAFMEQLVEELNLNIGCDNIFKISAMQSGNSTDVANGDLLSQFVQVLSFDSSDNYVNKEIPVEVAGAFSSGYLSSVYVSQDFVAALNVGSTYNPNTMSWDQSTFILGFDISNPIPKPFSFGEVPGSPINDYATDLYDDHLRIATTEWSWSAADQTSRTSNKIFILELPSSSENPEMKITGVTPHLGKENESIYAVRFIGDKAYVVTFLNIDPFLIVDLSDYSAPRVVGELEIPGFSSYLHPIEIDGVPLMLGVGQQVNETNGWTTGVKISLFDISNPERPIEVTSLVDENAYSNAQNDFKSFRYLPLSKKLILPKSEYTWTSDGNFDGFVVYDVSMKEIKPSYEISHATSIDIYSGCWYDAYLPPRSLVFQSKLTTILSHSVISTKLETGDEEWRVNLDEGLNKTKTPCWSYFRGFY